MNLFSLVGDLLHVASFVILLLKILKTKSVSGISFKSQLLYVMVFGTRYADLLVLHFVSPYIFLMKVAFLACSSYVVYLMRYRFKGTYDSSLDTFKIEYLLGASLVLALLIHYELGVLELLWSFSIFLEAMAILPQLFMLQRTGEAETITAHYLFALGGYRAMYLLNWIYRWVVEARHEWISPLAGVAQTALYIDFFYIYVTRVMRGKKFELPA